MQVQSTGLNSPQESSTVKSSSSSVTEDGTVNVAMSNERANPDSKKDPSNDQAATDQKVEYSLAGTEHEDEEREASEEVQENAKSSSQKVGSESYIGNLHNIIFPKMKSRNQLSRRNTKSIWMLAYIAAVTAWPLVGWPYFCHGFPRGSSGVSCL